jgi:hypothetical protein
MEAEHRLLERAGTCENEQRLCDSEAQCKEKCDTDKSESAKYASYGPRPKDIDK